MEKSGGASEVKSWRECDMAAVAMVVAVETLVAVRKEKVEDSASVVAGLEGRRIHLDLVGFTGEEKGFMWVLFLCFVHLY